MWIPQYQRIDSGEPTALTRDQIYPHVLEAMRHYTASLTDLYPNMLTPEEVTEDVLDEMSIVLIEEDYLLGYVIDSGWLTRDTHLSEEFLIRVGKGPTTLRNVLDLMKTLATLHGATAIHVGTLAMRNKAAGRRLYEREGLTELYTTMRIPNG